MTNVGQAGATPQVHVEAKEEVYSYVPADNGAGQMCIRDRLFGDEVSEATKKAVGGFLELNDEASLALKELSWSAREVTAEMAETISGNFSKMAEQVQTGLDKHHQESLAKIEGFVHSSTGLSKEEQNEILGNMQKLSLIHICVRSY